MLTLPEIHSPNPNHGVLSTCSRTLARKAHGQSLIKDVSALAGGSGGGRPDLAKVKELVGKA